jgi:aspartyl protease family protein
MLCNAQRRYRFGIAVAVVLTFCLAPLPGGAQTRAGGLERPLSTPLAIQFGLIWTGHLNAVVDGRFGPLTQRAVVDWQRSRGLEPNGKLDAAQVDSLLAEAALVRDGFFRWSTFVSSHWGYSMGYPKRFFTNVKETAEGTDFSGPSPEYALRTIVAQAPSEAVYADLFASTLKTFGDAVEFSAKNADYFVIVAKPIRNGHEHHVYVRFDRRRDYVVAFFLAYPTTADTRWTRAVAAMSSSFNVPAVPSSRVALQFPSRSQPPDQGETGRGKSLGPSPKISTDASKTSVRMVHTESGLYLVPVLINGVITLDFALDSGASDVSIPADVVKTLMRAGTITASDFAGEKTYVLADGSKHTARTFRIRSLKIGDRIVEDVMASVAPVNSTLLLLGQSFLGRFRSLSIDNTNHLLVLEY